MRYSINHLAVWILVVVQMGLGALWYSPLLFGGEWMTLLGFTEADLDPSDPVPYSVAFVNSALLTYFLAWLLLRLEVDYLSEALKTGFLLWLCAIAVEHATHYVFQGIDYRVLLIDMGKTLVGILIATSVLASWRRRAS